MLFILASVLMVCVAPEGTADGSLDNLHIIASMSPVLTDVDLDLHVYTPDNKHVGVNYSTDNYDLEIPIGIWSGDMWQGSEWISVDYSFNPRFVVVAENMQEGYEYAYGGEGTYIFEISFFDPDNHYCKAEAGFSLQAGESREHTFSIEVKTDGTYEIKIDNQIDGSEPTSTSAEFPTIILVCGAGLFALIALLIILKTKL